MEETTQNNEFHHYHNISINMNSVIQKITPPILFSLTLLAIVKMEGRSKELLYPLGGFAGLCIWNNFW
jgi:hypothetical protein